MKNFTSLFIEASVPSPPLVINVRYSTAPGGFNSPDVHEGKGVCSLPGLACPALQAVDVPSLLVLLPALAALPVGQAAPRL